MELSACPPLQGSSARQKRLGLWRLHNGYGSTDGSTVTSVHHRKFTLGLGEGYIHRNHKASASLRIENRKPLLNAAASCAEDKMMISQQIILCSGRTALSLHFHLCCNQ